MNKILAMLAVVAVVIKAASAQIPFSQTGRALDVDTTSGAWEANTLRQSMGPSGNLYVTGQVSGGFSFRGRVPYSGVNELNLLLPSERIDNFTRDSIGLSNVVGGRSYRPQAYTPASRQVTSLGDRTMPTAGQYGSYSLGAPAPTTVIIQRAAPEATSAYAPILTPETMAGLMTRTDGVGELPMPEMAPDAVLAGMAMDRPGVSALFGFIEDAQRKKLAEQVAEQEQAQLEAEQRETPPLPSEREAAPEGDPERLLPTEPAEPLDADEDAETGRSRDGAAGEPPQSPMASGQDVFVDVLVTLSRRRYAPSAGDFIVGAAEGPANLERLDADPSQRVEARRAQSVLAGSGALVTLRNLGGQRDDRFNRLMATGDTLLSRKQFYQAAARYESARQANSLNPLAPLGAGLAYLGAGETFRASHYLQTAVKIFPEMRNVRVDVDHLLGEDVVAGRLAQIEGRLGDELRPADAPLVFLVAYMHANRGDVGEARQWARKLRPLVEGDPRLLTWTKHLIGEAADGDQATP